MFLIRRAGDWCGQSPERRIPINGGGLMRVGQCFVALLILAGLALVPTVASAQTSTASDVLSESFVDTITGLPIPLAVPPGPPPLSFSFAEASEPFDVVVTLPPREINFIEPQTGGISDRLSILTQYQVRVASDGDPAGLPRRTANSTLIPASALETFQPIRIIATSDSEFSNQTSGS